VLDLETVVCFRALHEIRLEPKKTTKPHVDRRSSVHPAQSASVKVLTRTEDDLLILNPSFMVPFKYLSIFLTVAQWSVVGA
jgi:hypothetical protein